MAGMDKFTAEMKKKLDLTEEPIATTRQKSQDDWKKRALYNMSEAAQESISSSSDRDLKPDVDIASPSRRKQLRQQRWLENRGSGSVLSQSSESPRRWLQRQDSEVTSRLNERKSNTSELGPRKGGEPGEKRKKEEGESSEQQVKATNQSYEAAIREIARLEELAGPETQAKTARMAEEFKDYKPHRGRPPKYPG
jgi:hypothetical protein